MIQKANSGTAKHTETTLKRTINNNILPEDTYKTTLDNFANLKHTITQTNAIITGAYFGLTIGITAFLSMPMPTGLLALFVVSEFVVDTILGSLIGAGVGVGVGAAIGYAFSAYQHYQDKITQTKAGLSLAKHSTQTLRKPTKTLQEPPKEENKLNPFSINKRK